ncbi:MAG: hypothetical protein K2Q32_05270 [Alphaproteobacteria bacterium]|nr:hypothetical protein [Alphaproteobacteria bacterium]
MEFEMSNNKPSSKPTLSDVADLVYQTELPDNSWVPREAISRTLGKISRATGFYKLLWTPEEVEQGLNRPENREHTLAGHISLGL